MITAYQMEIIIIVPVLDSKWLTSPKAENQEAKTGPSLNPSSEWDLTAVLGIVVQLIGLDASCFSSLVFNTKLHQAGVERLPQPVGVAGQQGTEQTHSKAVQKGAHMQNDPWV